jgi:exopolysaccharide biosynthesis protein
MKDGTVWLIVVDGRSWQSVGMSLTELADFLNKMGIYNAMNLDGGGSSEMVVNQKIKNKPSDGAERSVGSSIIIIPRKSSR